MEEVRQLVQEEGREARNLVAFHVSVDTPAARVSRKPPRSVVPPARRAPPRNPAGARLRSASAGRDKRSELRARYWALLFGDLQRAIGEIYNTVETHENLSECQEVILVLENYTRDFKALGEWFRLKWEYDNTPPPQRPQSLAWEIRKTDFVRPESRRAYSVKSSPSVSGKNSPSLSGHNTPSGKNSPVTGKASPGSGKISPRISHVTSPKGNIEFFSNKINSKITAKPEPKVGKETRLSDIKEKDKEFTDVKDVGEIEDLKKPVVEVGKAKECFNVSPKPVVVKSKSPQPRPKEISEQAKATTRQLDAMENEFLEKQLMENKVKNDNMVNQDIESEKSVEVDKDKDGEVERKDSTSTESPTKSDDNFADVSNESTSPNNSKESSSPTDISEDKTTESDNNEKLTDVTEECVEVTPEKASEDIASQENIEGSVEKTELKDLDNNKSTDTNKEVIDKEDTKKQKESDKEDLKKDKPVEQKNTRPAYSQAAAKPKLVTSKSDNKIATRPVTTVARSKNVVEAPNVVPKTRQFPKRNQTSKCSYPFNLTTGRTSLFDAPPATTKPVAKKPIRNIQIGSGDSKTVNKIDVKKHPTRPTTLKINEKGDKKEKNNPSLENIKDCDEYSSSETIVTQIDMSRIESSESLKTLVPEELQIIQDVANSIEVLNVDNNKSDNEGWLTVKSRRLSRESKKQSKSHWANRFHQPSATTSLPTLNMISPKQESNPILNKPPIKVDRAKSEQPEKRKAEKVKVTLKPKSASKAKDPAMIRQKSDVTGLKTHSAKNKIGRKSEKVKDSPEKEGELTKNRLHSSLESLTMGLARSQESTEPVFDFDKWKAEFTSTFKYLDEDDQIPNHNEILKSADPSEMSEIAEMTSQIEENERKMCLALDFQTDVDQRKLCEEEDLLNRQIMELQQVSDIDLDTETDDTETDAEILCPSHTPPPGELGALAASLEDQYETALAGMTWAERVDTLVVLEALVARDPGRAQQLHAKLSQGIKRRGSFQDALRRLQAKQARAERQRLEYQTERAKKIHQLLGRVEEVKAAKNQLTEEKRLRMERRLQRAAENRDQHLKDIVRKAHDEEEKLREIAFIKQLEAENRRHEFMDQCRAHTSRLRHMRRDRLCKLEQKAAREAAVGARRQALEAARKLHVETLLEKRKERDARVEEMKGIKKQERDDAAREKAEGVKSRLSALAAAAELEADALRSRIRDKQDASQMRLESHLQAIREKATGPRQPTTSESQDQISKEEKELQEETERAEQERREREKQKAVKKKARKVKQKLLATSNDTTFTNQQINEVTYIEPSTTKLLKVINQLKNLLAPLLDSENNENGKIEDEEDRNRKNKKITNGFENEGAEKKKKKKRASEERHVIENKENGDDKEESIPDDKKKKNLEKVERKNSKEIQEEKESRKKKKRNKEVDKERPRLIKTSSVCSSLSETSKVVVSERASALERQLNELCRVLDKAIESPPWPPLRPALAALGQVLEAATHHTLSHRCLTTAANMLWTLLSGSSAVGAYLLTHSAAVHLTRLLSVLLERELLDARECELVSRLCACAGAVLSGAHDRARAHTLVSYLCLSGCFAREHCESVRPSVLALLATCAELCQPSDTDTGPERASALQSLRCALGPSLCHARGELCAQFDHAPHVAATAHMLRATATLDHKIVQEAFGSGGWALELRAAVARLLALHAPGDRDPPRTAHGTASEKEQNMSEALVIDLIVLVGFVVVNNPQLQETICSGWSVIKTLCTLPAAWLVCPRRSRALLPTLAAMGTSARAVIAHDLNTQILDEYLDSPEAQNVKLVQVIKQGRAKKAAAKK